MRKYIFTLIIAFFASYLLNAQTGQEAVNQLLDEYQINANLSSGEAFSDKNDNSFLKLFISNSAMVSSLGLTSTVKDQVPVSGFVNLIKGKFDEESDISLVLKNILIKKPSKTSSNNHLYKVTALQNFAGFKKDGSDFSSTETIRFEIDYSVSSNTAKIISIEQIDKQSGLYIGIHALACMTSFNSDLSSNVKGSLETKSKFDFGFGLSVDYMFSEKFGFTTGITMMSYSSTFTLTNFEQAPYSTIDKDGDSYELMAVGSQLNNEVQLKYIEIPIGIVMRFGGFFTRLGLNYCIAGSATSTFTDGDITTSGYYPEYNVLLYDIPEYGFDTYDLSATEGLIMSESMFSMFIQAGVNIPLSEKLNLSFLGFYQSALSSVINSETNNITSGDQQDIGAQQYYTSVLNLMDSPKATAFGLKVGLSIMIF